MGRHQADTCSLLLKEVFVYFLESDGIFNAATNIVSYHRFKKMPGVVVACSACATTRTSEEIRTLVGALRDVSYLGCQSIRHFKYQRHC